MSLFSPYASDAPLFSSPPSSPPPLLPLLLPLPSPPLLPFPPPIPSPPPLPSATRPLLFLHYSSLARCLLITYRWGCIICRRWMTNISCYVNDCSSEVLGPTSSTTVPVFIPFCFVSSCKFFSSSLPPSLISLLFLPWEGLDSTQIFAVREFVREMEGARVVLLYLFRPHPADRGGHRPHEPWRDPTNAPLPPCPPPHRQRIVVWMPSSRLATSDREGACIFGDREWCNIMMYVSLFYSSCFSLSSPR